MFDIFGQIRALIKKGSVNIDNNIFSLHYRLTVLVIFMFSVIVGSRKYFGDPIDCTAPNDDIARIVDNFCWFNNFIIVPRESGAPFEDNYHPVISNFEDLKDLNKDFSKYKAKFLPEYQWIEFILFIQAVLFFLPRYLWRYCWENGRVKALTEPYKLISLKHDDETEKNKDVIAYLRKNKYDHFEYGWKFIICEVINFANSLTQYLLLKQLLGLSWSELANDLLWSVSNHNVHSPINQVFPNLARCEVPLVRGAGAIWSQEICVLPVNVFTTKIYIFLWFHLLILAIISGLGLIYRAATLISADFRSLILRRNGRGITSDSVKAIRNLGYGEWFILCLCGKNMDPTSFTNLIRDYNDELIAARPSVALVDGEKFFNADLGALRFRKNSEKSTPKL
ncbi:unnamed protein product [Orchesella dallaii]|uniref:Innexin n=1 Tax=Orchesella dallaii TaxID=48710 RepID=A0ABP1RDT3_9HEXA